MNSNAETSFPPLRGAVLIGGESRRMGRDKLGLLRPDGLTFLEGTVKTLSALLSSPPLLLGEGEVPVSLARYPRVPDALRKRGPLGGIVAALENDRLSAWLVVPCDMPGLDEATLARLIGERDPACWATAFRFPDAPKWEPFPAIFEPAALPALRAELAHSGSVLCALEERKVKQAPIPRSPALRDVDTPQELEEWLRKR
ncbi:MAG: molybdenum cofactor guanylyltransferase [Myxococcales bacterium]|nr:MAG: molybdenum cofactor guanylyltransferase [Myxococcales bacterium]